MSWIWLYSKRKDC